MAIPTDGRRGCATSSQASSAETDARRTLHDDRDERRRTVREQLLARAREDTRIVGAAITGSAAGGAQDRWSDIDLFFGVVENSTVTEALDEWSSIVYQELGALHHFDLCAGPTTYRAFLLRDLLEVDLGFTPSGAFGPLGDGEFRLVFGTPTARQTRQPATSDAGHLVGLAWHHVLHARSSIDRDRLWQAEHWISAIRDHTLTLACLRLGLPAAHAKGADRLPADILAPMRDALVRSLDTAELSRALRATTRELLRELRTTDPTTAERLAPPLCELSGLPADT